ncbi:MAG: rhodanese-like domain-containing protein [Gammaproteobacteria bacterium]|nr:rhodanese-like domain-containing protein [Gammaproteobacteria bacterium]
MKRFMDLLNECLPTVQEIFPWDLVEELEAGSDILVLDVREPYEYDAMHIEGSLSVPRGILESAVEWGYEETLPELVEARDRRIVVVCRSGNRSLLAAKTMTIMGYKDAINLKTGLRGWNDYEQPLVDAQGRQVSLEQGDAFFFTRVRQDQLGPKTD